MSVDLGTLTKYMAFDKINARVTMREVGANLFEVAETDEQLSSVPET